MIGKPLRTRYVLDPLPAARAVAALRTLLGAHATPLVEVRAQGPHMVACLVARADRPSVKLCETLGLAVAAGASVVFGLAGADVARLVPQLSESQRAWLAQPCGPRETKVLLLAGGIAALSVEARGGQVEITARG